MPKSGSACVVDGWNIFVLRKSFWYDHFLCFQRNRSCTTRLRVSGGWRRYLGTQSTSKSCEIIETNSGKQKLIKWDDIMQFNERSCRRCSNKVWKFIMKTVLWLCMHMCCIAVVVFVGCVARTVDEECWKHSTTPSSYWFFLSISIAFDIFELLPPTPPPTRSIMAVTVRTSTWIDRWELGRKKCKIIAETRETSRTTRSKIVDSLKFIL